MKIACVVEGETEYESLPTILARCGHITIGILHMKGGNNAERAWHELFEHRVNPRALAMARKRPDKLLIMLDREWRNDCAPKLAQEGLLWIRSALANSSLLCPIALIVADRCFENILFADYELADKLSILESRISVEIGPDIDGVNVMGKLKKCMKSGTCFQKRAYGPAMARHFDFKNPAVYTRSRCLRKLIKELEEPAEIQLNIVADLPNEAPAV